MTTSRAAIFFFVLITTLIPPLSHALGSGSTVAISHASATVCGIVAEQNIQRIQCYTRGHPTLPDISFSSISGGRTFFCGLVSGGYALLCWDISSANTSVNFSAKRLYFNYTDRLKSIAVGEDHVCGIVNDTGVVHCWRGDKNFEGPNESERFELISSGSGFSCGILMVNKTVRCWGNNNIVNEIESQFGNMSMLSIVAGSEHVCGLNTTGFVVCKGRNSFGQLDVPLNLANGFSRLALGRDHSCGIMSSNGSVVCWGNEGRFSGNEIERISFESIVSSQDFVCGLTSRNLSVICWGPGWQETSVSGRDLPISDVLPGPCVQSDCNCGIFPDSQRLCSGNGNICKPCLILTPQTPLSPPPAPSPVEPPGESTSKGLERGLLAFAIVGSVGAFLGICTVIYCVWTGVCFGKKKIHNSVQPTITRGGSNGHSASTNSPLSRSSTIRRQGSRAMRRQRSGTSGSKHTDRAEEFTLADLAAATNNFSPANKIGSGSFGVVYRGKLIDGREVAIKRGETGSKAKKFQEKETAFDSELAFLSRLHHKHLVRLVGYCEEKDERLLVYEYMKNGALHDHLHDKNNIDKASSVVNSWKMRIKIALDAARGIEYLHNYAVPPIIHRDIKSSNILLDENWTARVSDFGLSLMGPESNHDYKPLKAAGTVGYIDPEYYSLNVLSAQSDVYGLGVVLLELLTGKRAIFRKAETGSPVSVVDYAVPSIMNEDLVTILDPRVGPPTMNEAEAVELIAYTAMHCVNLEGRERPTMTDIVANLERALALCDDSHGSLSSNSISIVTE